MTSRLTSIALVSLLFGLGAAIGCSSDDDANGDGVGGLSGAGRAGGVARGAGASSFAPPNNATAGTGAIPQMATTMVTLGGAGGIGTVVGLGGISAGGISAVSAGGMPQIGAGGTVVATGGVQNIGAGGTSLVSGVAGRSFAGGSAIATGGVSTGGTPVNAGGVSGGGTVVAGTAGRLQGIGGANGGGAGRSAAGGSSGAAGTAHPAGSGAIAGSSTSGGVAGNSSTSSVAGGGFAGSTTNIGGAAGATSTARTLEAILKYWGGADCYACATSNCASDDSAAGTDVVVAQGCDALASQDDRDLCHDVVTCEMRTDCTNLTDMSNSGCYCGTSTNCIGGAGIDGVCKASIEAGLKSTDPTEVTSNFKAISRPGGRASALVECLAIGIQYGGPELTGDPRCSACFSTTPAN